MQLPLDYTWQSLRDLCREFGDIRFAEIRSKGTGTVRFQTESDARRAVGILFYTHISIPPSILYVGCGDKRDIFLHIFICP